MNREAWIALIILILGLYKAWELVMEIFMFFLRLCQARTRRGSVRSKPLMGGATPPTKAQDCRASPAMGGAIESDLPTWWCRCGTPNLNTAQSCECCGRSRIAPPIPQVSGSRTAIQKGIES